jgi:hypothetical protein
VSDTVATDFGPPRRTGFYAGVFEIAQRDGTPIRAVAFRRGATSTVEIYKLDNSDEASGVVAALIRDGVAFCDIWPIAIGVGRIDDLTVKVSTGIVEARP